MRVNTMRNLYVGYNETENFTILICAFDRIEAQEIADDYCLDAYLEGKFKISEFEDREMRFDCDYVLTGGQGV